MSGKVTFEEIYQEIFKGDAFNHYPTECINEIIPGRLFIGNRDAALSLETLTSRGVTHVLNMAQGEGEFRVDTDADYYASEDIRFMGVEAEDAPFYDVAAHFDDATRFIDDALTGDERAKVFVHCREGYSRAPTIVCAYLMLKRQLDLLSALRLINDRRKVCPNVGFMEQLIDLDFQLRSTKSDRVESVDCALCCPGI